MGGCQKRKEGGRLGIRGRGWRGEEERRRRRVGKEERRKFERRRGRGDEGSGRRKGRKEREWR
jgi:hypothetical protein